MSNNSIISLNEENIRTAIDDYARHTYDTSVLDEISDSFIRRLAIDNFHSKAELRALFSTSPAWNNELQAIVINGTRTHNTDYERVDYIACQILQPYSYDALTCQKIVSAIRFFSKPDDYPDEYIAAIQELAPKAYRPNKKKSRIFKALCDALGISDDSAGSPFQRLFAQFADELSAKKIDFKLFVSINPAHFLTMSNPKEDKRGSSMVSCHSLNSTEYPYNNGCVGYARDKYTFIIFTASDPAIPETLNNRKTSRQICAYKPNNGVLLQSRLYSANSGSSYGGINGDSEESKLYRDLIQRELSDLENAPNLWKTKNYCNNDFGISIYSGLGFGGYKDWTYSDFSAKISVRNDHADDFEEFEIGTYGLCLNCADEIDEGLFCEYCSHDNRETCDDCGDYSDNLFPVRNHRGETIYVCEACRDANYSYCEFCEEYYPANEITYTGDDETVCQRCIYDHYYCCDFCHEYYREEDISDAVDIDDNDIVVCRYCRDEYCRRCEDCGRYFQCRSNSDSHSHECHCHHNHNEHGDD